MAHPDSYENLAVDRTDGVVNVTMESTSRFNALNHQMTEELVDVATWIGTLDDARCVTLTGSDGVYSSGADLGQFDGDAGDEAALRTEASLLHDALVAFHQAELPLVGGVNGVAAGAGFGLALFPDVVVMSDEARLEFAYSRIGLTGDGGVTHLLPRLVGLREATEIVLRDDPIGPERALDLGLVSETVPAADLDDRVAELAADFADGPTHALGTTKRLFWESHDRSLADQLAAETEAMADAVQTDDYERGMDAFPTDEEPDFTGE